MKKPQIHPAAELFPMMPEQELNELADDIKARGLINPILLDAEGRMIDGRNRWEACKLAGVEPTFETMNGKAAADAIGLVVSLNVKRRNLSSSQRAMAAAKAWALAEQEGKVQTQGGDRKSKAQSGHLIAAPRDHFAVMFGVSKTYVEQARALLRDDPLAAEAVQNGAPLKQAYEAMQERRGDKEAEARRLGALKRTRPDLHEAVVAGKLTLTQAENQERAEAEAAEALRSNQQEQALRVAESGHSALMTLSSESFAQVVSTFADDKEFRRQLRERVQPMANELALLERGARFLHAILEGGSTKTKKT